MSNTFHRYQKPEVHLHIYPPNFSKTGIDLDNGWSTGDGAPCSGASSQIDGNEAQILEVWNSICCLRHTSPKKNHVHRPISQTSRCKKSISE